MSNPGWNPAGFMQPPDGAGRQDQQQVGGVKLFDPTQFQTPHQQQPLPEDTAGQQNSVPNSSAGAYFQPQNQQGFQTQAGGQGSSWDSWGNWNWNTDGQNAELSGQSGGNYDAASGSSVDGAAGSGQQPTSQDQQQFGGQFSTPQQYQNGGYAGGEYQQGGYQPWQNAEQNSYNYYDQTQPQWMGQEPGQPPQEGSGQGQYFYQGQQPQQTFDPSAWNNHSGGEGMQGQPWGNVYNPQAPQGYDTQSAPEAGGGESHTQTSLAQPFSAAETTGTAAPGVTGSIASSGAGGMFAPPPSIDIASSHVSKSEHGHTRESSIDSNVSGTVSGFFGHGDSESQSESSPMASPRRGEVAASNPNMQHLKVTGFERTDSGISNASLQTVNLSGDEDAKDGVEDVAGQMGQMNLGGQGAVESAPPNPQLYDHPGDFSGFGNYDSTPPQPNQPLQQMGTGEVEESREMDQQSPVLNDWEIVPPAAQSSTSHSRTNSLDDGIKFTARPQEYAASDNQPAAVPKAAAEASAGNPAATHSSSTQDSESFTAISSSSSTRESYSQSSVPYSDRGSSLQHPSASSTPFTSPGTQSVVSQSSPLSSQPSPVRAAQPQSSDKSPSVASPAAFAPPKVGQQQQQQQQSSSSVSSASGSPVKSTSQSQSDQSPTKERSPEAAGAVNKSADTSEGSVQTGRPPPSPGPRGAGSRGSPEKDAPSDTSSRRHHSAFHPVHRAKHNMSPATTLWDNMDSTPAVGNILLAPAAPLIIPSLGTNTQSGTTASTTTTSSTKPGSLVGKSSSSGSLERLASGRRTSERTGAGRYGGNGRRGNDRKEGERNGQNKSEDLSRSRDDDNRSLGSLDELDAMPDYSDDSRDRSRGYGRDPRYDPYYDRPSSRTDSYRDDYRRQPRDPYRSSYGRDYRNPYYDERYDRPRSRQDEERSSRPSSRSGRDLDRPASRSEYDRDRDVYYQHHRDARYKGYPGYDPYTQDYYYDDRERYYRYYTDSRYRRGYAEEMGYYEQYDRFAGYYGQHRPPSIPPGDDLDRSSIASQSRGQTPALDEADASKSASKADKAKPPPSDYYSRSSRPSSRMDRDRERDPYRQGYGGYGPYDPYAGYYDPYHQYQYPYYQYPQYEQSGYQQGRMTPPKYILPHVRVCFGPTGQLVTVLPNRPAEGQPATVEIHDVQVMLQENPEVEELRTYPGPLVRNETHKNDVLLLCQKKARECAENIDMLDRESAELIWRLLELLLKQNGTIIGTDIADLLLSGHEPTTHEYSVTGMRIVPSTDHFEEGEESSRGSSPAVRVAADRTVVTATQQLEEATDRFRHLLLYGRKKEALDHAMKRNLWGHALFLASKMDNRTHASVMTRFANTAMRMNDPLQTLYQLMSGRQPASVTNVVDERWGDWRPHLAMILSNHSSRPDLDKKSIVTLGDTLATKHCLHASHFCYLMAQVEFGSFSKKTSKIVLIGSNHNLPLDEFANNSAIQCTEVYEYAQTLGNAKFCLPQFQVYKFLYACRLADCGLAHEAFHYCEIIAQQVLVCPARFHPTFVTILYTLASRLKFSDPQKLHEGYDSADPVWLQQLCGICQSYEEGSLQYKSGSATPMTGHGGMTPSSEGEVASYGMDSSGGAGAVYQQEGANYTGAGYNYQQATQYGGAAVSQGEAGQQQYTGATEQYGQYANSQYGQQATGDQYNWQQQQQQQQHYDPSQYQQQQWQNYDPNQGASTDYSQSQGMEQHNAAQTQAANYYGAGETGAEQQLQQQQQHHQQPATAHAGYGGYNQQQMDHGEEDEDDDDEGDEDDVDAQQSHSASQFDYFDIAAKQQQIVAPPHRYRSTSTSSGGSTRRRRTTSGSSTGSVRAANPSKPAAPPSKSAESKKEPAGQQKGGGGGGGWFNGFFSKFGRSNKNEMILPDDKNPSIVWDPVLKKWSNKDGDDVDSAPAAPPPKDADLMGKMPGPPGPAPPSMGPSAAMNGPPAANRFSMAKGRGAKYVDVLNPGGGSKSGSSPVPPTLFNVTPATTSATPQLFNPSGAPASSSQAEVPSSQQSNLLAPPSHDLSRSSSLSSLSREIQQLTMKAQEFGDSDAASAQSASTAQPPAMPMMFNPSQLSQSGAQPSGSGGPGLKYGHRRVYPK